MSPAEVRKIVEKEIGGDWSRSNLHGVNLQRCLLKVPEIRTLKNSWFKPALPESADNRRTVALWLVLEEDPAGHGGYSIVFREAGRQFGLAHAETFIGYYGSFLDTLAAM
jgi:hypothetical protein